MFWKRFWQVIGTIILVPLSIVGAVCATPFALILMVIAFPVYVVGAIWGKKQW